jgi:large subunit ribosomal protein L17
LAKAKAVRPFAEKMITLGKRDDLHSRRVAFASLRQKEAVRKLFAELAPRTSARQGGYCRIVKLGPRLTPINHKF